MDHLGSGLAVLRGCRAAADRNTRSTSRGVSEHGR